MDPRETWHLPTRHLGRRVLFFDSVASTNDLALEYEPGTAIHADVQTAGRGRLGREWVCPPGAGIQLSLTLDPPEAMRRPVVLTAWAAVAVAETVRRLTGIPARIKWPNDILLHGRKVAGILVEMKSVVVAGIGLNLNQPREWFESAGLPDAGSLSEATGGPLNRDEAIRQLLVALDDDYDSIVRGEWAALPSRWAWHIGLLGRDVEVETLDGERRLGRLVDLTFDGATIENTTGDRMVLAPERVRQLRPREQ